jgi:formate hydrogenlyase subunit 3
MRESRAAASVSWSDNRTFYPVGLAILGLFGAASLSRHLGIIAILIEGAVILAVFVIQGGRVDSTRAALRFLVLMSLATPLFLLAAWRIDFYQLSGGLQTGGNLEQTTLLVGFGFALWLAIVPFHSWLTTTSAESAPATAAFVLIAFPIIAFSTMIHLLADFPWLVDSPQAVRALMIAGVVTAFLGGVMAGVQRGFSELMGYAALFDLGCTLALLGRGGETGVITILVSLTGRALALTLIAASTSALRLRAGSDGFAEFREMAQQMPVATAGQLWAA